MNKCFTWKYFFHGCLHFSICSKASWHLFFSLYFWLFYWRQPIELVHYLCVSLPFLWDPLSLSSVYLHPFILSSPLPQPLFVLLLSFYFSFLFTSSFCPPTNSCLILHRFSLLTCCNESREENNNKCGSVSKVLEPLLLQRAQWLEKYYRGGWWVIMLVWRYASLIWPLPPSSSLILSVSDLSLRVSHYLHRPLYFS